MNKQKPGTELRISVPDLTSLHKECSHWDVKEKTPLKFEFRENQSSQRPPRGRVLLPYSQEVHLAPSLQEHPCELHHPVDIERLEGHLVPENGLTQVGDTFPNSPIPPHMCRTKSTLCLQEVGTQWDTECSTWSMFPWDHCSKSSAVSASTLPTGN